MMEGEFVDNSGSFDAVSNETDEQGKIPIDEQVEISKETPFCAASKDDSDAANLSSDTGQAASVMKDSKVDSIKEKKAKDAEQAKSCAKTKDQKRTAKLKLLSETNENLKKENERHLENIKNLTENNERLTKENERIKIAAENIVKLKQEKHDLEESNKSLEERIEKLKEELNSIKKTEEEGESKIKHAAEKIVKLSEQISIMEQSKTDLQESNKKLQNEITTLRRDITNWKEDLAQSKEKNEEDKKVIARLNAEIKRKAECEKELHNAKTSFEQKVKHLTSENKKWTEDMKTLTAKKIQLEKEHADHQQIVNMLLEDHENVKKEYEKTLDSLNQNIKNLNEHITKLTNEKNQAENLARERGRTLQQRQAEMHEMNEKINCLEKDKKDLTLRLSKLAGANLTFNNPNIADLSDENRPTKLAEEFSELYDNEWTDAFENIDIPDEGKKTQFMLSLLKRASDLCHDASKRHMNAIKQSFSTLSIRDIEVETVTTVPDVSESTTTMDDGNFMENEMETDTQQPRVFENQILETNENKDDDNNYCNFMDNQMDTDTSESRNQEEQFSETSGDREGEIKGKQKETNVDLGQQNLSGLQNNNDNDKDLLEPCIEPCPESVRIKPMVKTASKQIQTTYYREIPMDYEQLANEQKKNILDIRNMFEKKINNTFIEVCTEIIVKELSTGQQNLESSVAYIKKCTTICWSMCRHEPPVHIHFPEIKGDLPFDTNMYKPYTKTGKHLDFVVWPALYLHENGPMLAKGVAQGRK